MAVTRHASAPMKHRLFSLASWVATLLLYVAGYARATLFLVAGVTCETWFWIRLVQGHGRSRASHAL